jgi:integrase/recombinase XerD
VNAFKRMADSGMDMYVALPILSTYLGHSTIMATERYLKLTLELFPEIRDKMEKSMEEVFREADHA